MAQGVPYSFKNGYVASEPPRSSSLDSPGSGGLHWSPYCGYQGQEKKKWDSSGRAQRLLSSKDMIHFTSRLEGR